MRALFWPPSPRRERFGISASASIVRSSRKTRLFGTALRVGNWLARITGLSFQKIHRLTGASNVALLR